MQQEKSPMYKMRLFFFCFSFILAINQSYTQDIRTTSLLAEQAKENGEIEKAIDYYEELYEKTGSETYYSELLGLYIESTDFKSAEKIAKKRSRKYPHRHELTIDRGHVADRQKNKKMAEAFYKDAIKSIGKDEQSARTIANRFIQYGYFEWAEKTYLVTRKNSKNARLFRFELANVYIHQGKTSEMVDEYLDILASNRSYIQTVQNIFQRVLRPNEGAEQLESLKNKLLSRIQKDPDQEVFSQLLIWLYIQDENFYGALIQAKALDKRLGEKGKRVFSLGKLCLSNEDFESAEQSFQYVIGLGNKSPYYLKSRMKLLEVLKEKIISNKDYVVEDLMNLKNNYEETITELGKSSFTIPLIRGLANLNAYYIDNIDEAIIILEEAVRLNNIPKQTKAEIKIDLADLMLFKDEVWEASLLYSQVEKEYKYDRIGELAKFKNSKIAFYTGDFYWAQAQLNVLKGSTSKLISNDALQLSLLITDNIGLDSIAEPLRMYALADLMVFKKDYEKALVILDSIPKFFPSTRLKDEALFTKYKIALAKRDYKEAASHLESLLSEYAEDILGDDALFNLAKLEEERFKNKERAMELYKQLITTYPASLFVVESRKRFRALRGDAFQEEELDEGT